MRKYKKIRYNGTDLRSLRRSYPAKVRPRRMCHIELAARSSHLVFQSIPSRMDCCWTSPPRILGKVLYFAAYNVTDPAFPAGQKPDSFRTGYRDKREKYEDDFEAGMGAEAVKTAQRHQLDELVGGPAQELKEASGRRMPASSSAEGGRLRASGNRQNG
jgi:DNA-directed RNA polymerase subunit beta'